jgi:hypothetical protein
MLKKRSEAYQQKKTKEPEKRTKRCAQDRRRYANMHPDKKKAKIEQVKANRELKSITPCKESIAMLNLAYIPTEQEVLLEKQHEAYHQKKIKEPEQRIKRCAQDRHRYINMPSKKNIARIEKVTSNPELKSKLPWEESVVMVNPAYIATEEEVGTFLL